MTSNTFKRAKDRRKPSPGKRIVVSDETRKGYEETMRQIVERERSLPFDLKCKR
jgi:hypothetical protein